MALPAPNYPAKPWDGNEQTQNILLFPEGGTDQADASDYNESAAEVKAQGDDLRGANNAAGQANHTALHTDQEARLAALEGASAGAPATLKHIAPRWYGPISDFGAPSTLSPNDLHVIPIEIPETGDYDAIGLTAPVPVGSAKFAVYESDNGGFPGTKLKDFGSVAVSATTILAIAKFSLPGGFRWLAMIVSAFTSIHTINRASGDSVWESLTGRALLTDSFQGGFTISGETFAGGLPADLSLSSTPVQISNVSHVNIRKA